MFDDVFETLPGDGWLSKEEAKLLWTSVQATRVGAMLEVGCYKGRSTVLLASFGRTLHCVDPFAGFDSDDLTGEKTMRAWLANIQSRSISNVHLHLEQIETWTVRPVTFAYLDGDHSYRGTVTQIRVAKECGADTIAIHDVNDSGDGAEIKRAALELLGPWKDRIGRLAVWML